MAVTRVSKSMKSSHGIVSVFKKSNDSCQGSWLKDGKEGRETQGGFEGYSRDRAVKKRDEVDACRFPLSLSLSLLVSFSSTFPHFVILEMMQKYVGDQCYKSIRGNILHRGKKSKSKFKSTCLAKRAENYEIE